MIIIQDKLVSDALLEENFICNINACKGICCIEGDMGAPIDGSEIPILEKIYPLVKKYLTNEGVAAIEAQGLYINDVENNISTPLIDGKACAYIQFDSMGNAKCGIEIAYEEGVIDFKKPISCHLYPIRVSKLPEDSFEALNYDVWDICKDACVLGDKEKLPVFKFLKEPLIRKYGADFYEELDQAYEYTQKDKL